jgi:hypothetical protein
MRIAIWGAPGTGQAQLTRSLQSVIPPGCVLVDTDTLMHAICSHQDRADTASIADAVIQLRDIDLTLVMGMDLNLASEIPEKHQLTCSRVEADARLRAALGARGISYLVVYGAGEARTSSALQAIAHHAGTPLTPPTPLNAAWQWTCEKCSDARCEHRMFTDRLKIGERSAPP